MEKNCILSEAPAMASTWISESAVWSSRQFVSRSSLPPIDFRPKYRFGAPDSPIARTRVVDRGESWSATIGACGENRSENETSSGRHERGRLPGGCENVHAGRPSAATLREAAEGPGASAGLRDATGRCALLGRGATHHAARRIFAAGLQKGLSRWARPMQYVALASQKKRTEGNKEIFLM